MASTIPALEIRRRLGRESWSVPIEFGPDGWVFEARHDRARIIVTCGPAVGGGQDWLHASFGRQSQMPDYDDLITLHRGVWGSRGWAYQCFAPDVDHVNIHDFVLHLWGQPDGSPVLPNFGVNGSI